MASRALSLGCLLLALANPNLKNEDRKSLSNIAVVVADASSSMQLAARNERARQIEAELKDKLAKIPNLEVRWVHAAGTDQPGGEATNLFSALDTAMADIPPGPDGRRNFYQRRPGSRCAAGSWPPRLRRAIARADHRIARTKRTIASRLSLRRASGLSVPSISPR